MRNRLRAETAAAHRRLETVSESHRIMDGSLDPTGYRRIIDWQARAHLTLEPLIDLNTQSYRYASRLRVLPTLPLPDLAINLPPGRTTSLGLAYVLEGGSLGGAIILKRLRCNPNLTGEDMTFYTYQSAHGLTQWRAYLNFLDDQVLSEAESREVVSAANRAFEVFQLLW